MSAEAEGEGFLARWSRRKRAVPEPAADAAAVPVPELPETGAPPLPAGDRPAPAAQEDRPAPAAPARATCPIPDLPEIDPASLPRIEDLTADSDLSLFLRPGVPAATRSAALRRMWSLDPSIRDYIGPVEYQWDFNAPGGLPFGFAAELAGDLPRLLAQAIGQLPPMDEPGAPAPDPALQPAAEGGAAAADGPAADEAAPAVPAPSVPEAEEPVAARRRHGSALPA